MNIIIGDYRLTNDRLNFIISDKEFKTRIKDGKEIKEFKNKTYYSTIAKALNNVLRRRLMESDATTLLELKTELAEYKKGLYALLNEKLLQP